MFDSQTILTSKSQLGVIWFVHLYRSASISSIHRCGGATIKQARRNAAQKETEQEANQSDKYHRDLVRDLRCYYNSSDSVCRLQSDLLTEGSEPMGLRLVSNLMMGVTRIYSSQTSLFYSMS